MRLLHTGDWHVGKTIRGRSRMDEFERVLAAVVAIARDQDVDAVLLAGDIYDQRAATAETDTAVFSTLLELNAAGIPVIAIPGNHDSPARLEAFSRLLARIGVTVVPKVRAPESGGIVELSARDGTHAARIACIPFVPERRFSDATELFSDPDSLIGDYDDKMGQVLAAMGAAFSGDAVNIVMGHMFVDGARVGGGERTVTVGRNYAVSPANIPSDASYVALGHIHRPQQVAGCPSPTYYSGSLIQLDFGERDQDKFVNIIDAQPRKPAKVTAIRLEGGRRLVDLPPATLDEIPALAEGLDDAYLRVTARTDGPVPGIADRIREMLPNVLDVHLDYERNEAAEAAASLRSLQPREQFLAYYEAAHNTAPSDELLAAFDRVYEDAIS